MASYQERKARRERAKRGIARMEPKPGLQKNHHFAVGAFGGYRTGVSSDDVRGTLAYKSRRKITLPPMPWD